MPRCALNSKVYADETNQNYQTVLTYFAYDRLIQRLAQSQYSGQFMLKGGMLLRVWFDRPYRYTQDIDFEWLGEPYKHNIESALREIMSLDSNDGLNFNSEGLQLLPERFRRDEDEKKVLRFANFVYLGNSRIKLNIDIGYGGDVKSQIQLEEFPTILPSEDTNIQVYPKERVIAEKFHAMCSHKENPSRLKDLFDVWYLHKKFNLKESELVKTIRNIFTQRKDVSIPKEVPIILTESFANSQYGQILWEQYRKKVFMAEPTSFEKIRSDLRKFLMHHAELARKLD